MAKVIHTRLLFWARGFVPHPGLILINPANRGDVALLEHEKVHVAQMERVGWARFVWRYLTDSSFRLASEVEAYRVSIAHGRTVDGCARALCEAYFLDITYEQAKALLS